jgi:hypothetical protein
MKKSISPLRKMLNNLSVDDLLQFLQEIDLCYTIIRKQDKSYEICLRQEGMVDYKISGGKQSVKACIADALARFLINEQKDYHCYSINDKKCEV